ncbi:MAG: hypothetical protein KDK75_23365, partial [Alphaproteobacteria bacterium]|nr:hypothetical protein [Alphaproteobacteria bacterium]
MTQSVVITTPIINTPFDEPKRHYLFDEDGITNTIIEKRRVSEYYVPIPRAKKKSGQLSFETHQTADRREE